MSHLIKCGHTVLLPIGENQRYDLVIEENGNFKRVQCKTGVLINGSVQFRACSENIIKGKRVTYSYMGEVELIGVYCEELDAVYLVPVEHCANHFAALRIEPPRNNQKKRVRNAKDYQIVPRSWKNEGSVSQVDREAVS